MTNWKNRIIAVLVLCCLILCMSVISASAADEMPEPGTVIDKNNYQKFKHLFPPEALAGFESGWGGLYSLPSYEVVETTADPVPNIYREFSKKNNGKYTIAEDGAIAGGYDHLGIPFPELTSDDPKFANKLMWNFNYRYYFDDYTEHVGSWMKRKGEPTFFTDQDPHYFVSFYNRMFDDPKPIYETPENLFKGAVLVYTYPQVLRYQAVLSWRYVDWYKADETFIYLPKMRRVLRGEAGQRATPLAGSLMSLDDLLVFDGRIQEFTYKYIGETKVLGVVNNIPNRDRINKLKIKDELPWPNLNWQVKSVYIIDQIPKDPKYPQSRRRVYMDKENPQLNYWCVTWDRAGKPWKIFITLYRGFELANGEITHYLSGQPIVDLQSNTAAYVHWVEQSLNGNNFQYEDITAAALLMIGR